jgi:hypothetical protein
LEKNVDESLCKANAIYASVRKNNVIVGLPIAKCLMPGSFDALTKAREEDAPHVGRNQLKTPRVLANDKWLAFLKERVQQHASVGMYWGGPRWRDCFGWFWLI